MTPLSLLQKYLLLTLAACAMAVALTGIGAYLVLRASLEDGHAAGALVAALAMAAVIVLLIVFARRQSADIRLLTSSARRMAGDVYDGEIALPRRDELGELAASLEALRERLRTTTISRDYLDKVLASMSEALLLVSAQGVIRRANPAACRLLGCSEEELTGRALTALFAPAQRDDLRLRDSGGQARETTMLTADGGEVPVSCTVSAIQDSDPALRGFVIAARNIAERKVAERRIRYLARIDGLTKVPNRMQFQHLLQRTIARCTRQDRAFALLYIDVDRFKEINDTYGHSAGDHCLETLTARLGRLLPPGAIMGRFAGDEFGIIAESGIGGVVNEELAATARSILREVSEPLHFHGQQIDMNVSIGIAAFPADARNVIELVRCADAALYHAKRAGGDRFAMFDAGMNAATVDRLMLKSRLRRAYERDELLLHYQPKVDGRSGRIAGAEALVRWDLAERGRVPPAEFIPLAEESNLILEIGEWVLDRVCRDLRDWRARGLVPGRIAVNLSLRQLHQPEFATRVRRLLEQHGIEPSNLELEITESTLMEDPERTVRVLRELHGMGLSLAIDDFGTGYSSLGALQKFPIRTLKVDQSFVRDAATVQDDATIVTTIIQMGHGLKLEVVAEGVESPQQLALLRAAGCDYMQGLLFGEPMTAPAFAQLLQSGHLGAPIFGQLLAEPVSASR